MHREDDCLSLFLPLFDIYKASVQLFGKDEKDLQTRQGLQLHFWDEQETI